MTRAGEYRHPLTVQRLKAAAVADSYGHLDEANAGNWETYCQRRAKVTSQPGNEQHADQQTFALATHLIVIRADSTTRAITTRMRIVLGVQTLNVLSVVADQPRRNEILLSCRERQ